MEIMTTETENKSKTKVNDDNYFALIRGWCDGNHRQQCICLTNRSLLLAQLYMIFFFFAWIFKLPFPVHHAIEWEPLPLFTFTWWRLKLCVHPHRFYFTSSLFFGTNTEALISPAPSSKVRICSSIASTRCHKKLCLHHHGINFTSSFQL